MAKLILTEEEEAAPNYLDWSDEALANAVRELSFMLKDKYGKDAITMTSIVSLLVSYASDANAEETTFTLEGVSVKDKEYDDWEINIVKKT